MSDDASGLLEEPRTLRHLLGYRAGETPGPTLVVMASLHGNEPAGVRAAERVLRRLDRDGTVVRGQFIGLSGNLVALERQTRFVDHDLNRCWSPERVRALLEERPSPGAPVEDREQFELLQVLGERLDDARSPVYFIDLHTSSADGPPFVTVGDTVRNRRFAQRFPVPLILGLEEQVDGALLEFLNNRGVITMGVEAGRHDRPESVERLESVIYMALVFAGMLDRQAIPEFNQLHEGLRLATRDVPRVIEVRHRHAIVEADQFEMRTGYVNFQGIHREEPLARDKHGLILSPEPGLLLLPLYQGKGDDGFFVAREVRPAWLKVSTLLRYARLGALIRWMPGVRRDPRRPDLLRVDTRVARFWPVEIFHLLGYRKLRKTGTEVLVTRRLFELYPPRRIDLFSGTRDS